MQGMGVTSSADEVEQFLAECLDSTFTITFRPYLKKVNMIMRSWYRIYQLVCIFSKRRDRHIRMDLVIDHSKIVSRLVLFQHQRYDTIILQKSW